jgi:hypothetical protein
MTSGQKGAWRNGHWFHGWRHGRLGWWWWCDGGWYWYATQEGDYPTTATETVVYDAPPGIEANGNWWYCTDPAGYWPYVKQCNAPWQQVPPTPQPPAQ